MDKVAHLPSSEIPDTARHRALSAASRVRMLGLVRRAEGGLTATQVANATGLHPNTVRAHLDLLTRSGLLTRRRRRDGSPGRPAWRYQAVAEPEADAERPWADGRHRDLAAALIGHLARDADDPHAAGVRAGRDWGRTLTAPLTAVGEPSARPSPLDGLVQVLDRLGFTPEIVEQPSPSATVVALRSCPFLELALANPDVVCGVHHGVIGGVLGALGASAHTDLEPFAAPGACLIRLRIRPSAVPDQ